MKINDVNILVNKIEIKEKKDNKEKYLYISFIDMQNGDVFEVIEKDLSCLSKLQQMQKYIIDLNLSCNKYGLRLEIEDIKENTGSI